MNDAQRARLLALREQLVANLHRAQGAIGAVDLLLSEEADAPSE